MKLTSFTKSLNEDNSDSGLIIGKFRIITKEHTKLINEALKQFGKATIVVVGESSTLPLRFKALQNVYNKNNNVEIVQSKNSYVPDILPRCSFNPVALYSSLKNVKSYENMLEGKNLSNITVIDTMYDEDVAASKVITNLNDQVFFEKNTPVAIHHLYNEYTKNYSVLMCESWDILDTVDENLLEDEYRPSNDYQNIYPSTDYDDKGVRVPGDNENFNVYDTVKGEDTSLTPTVDCAENKQGSCVLDCPDITEGDGGEGAGCPECSDSVGTGTSDIATVDNVIGGNGMIKRKKPNLVTEHRGFTEYF